MGHWVLVDVTQQALLRHTPPTHPDYDNLARCYDGVQKVVLTVNENVRNAPLRTQPGDSVC